jgi:thiol-disulfide isomerase/thioredoxin
MIIAFIGLTIGFPLGGQQNLTTTLTTQKTTLFTSKQTSLKKAPEFSLPVYDLLSSTERYISLSDFSGKPVFLEFFSPACGHCIKMIPMIEELSKRYGGEMVFLVISTPTREQLKNVIEKYGLTQTILIDDKYEVFNKYEVEGTPTFIILDSSHNIVEVIVGERTMEAFKTVIERIIS